MFLMSFIYWTKSAIDICFNKKFVWTFIHIRYKNKMSFTPSCVQVVSRCFLLSTFVYLLSIHLFSSCSSFANNELLLRADSLMELRPDSALYILESIPWSQIRSRSDKAYYALLLTQARHENDIILETDSLIKSAVDYYDNGSKSLRAAQAHYYCGETYRDMGYIWPAIDEYQQAIQLVPDKSLFFISVYNALAECYLTVECGKEQGMMAVLDSLDTNRGDRLNNLEKATCYENLFRLEKDKGNCEAAAVYADSFFLLHAKIGDSFKPWSDKVMVDYQVSKQQKSLSHRVEIIINGLFITFSFLIIIGCFWFFWKDRKREKLYIALQKELVQNRVDTMLLKEQVFVNEEKNVSDKLVRLREQQMELCISMFQTLPCYKKFKAMEKATPKQLLMLCRSRKEIRDGIHHSFIDVMSDLKEYCSALTVDDQFYCVLSLLHCSKPVVMTLMDASSDAIKTRKNRIKNKMSDELFCLVFSADNQWYN